MVISQQIIALLLVLSPLITCFNTYISARIDLSIPLFKAYQGLKKKVAHKQLGKFPTNIQRLRRLGPELGIENLYVKNDSECCDIFGGNEVRKLEFLLGDALAAGAKSVLTCGFAGSNHTCATALLSHHVGLECICMHLPQIQTAYLRRNLLLSHLAGAELNLYKTVGTRDKSIHKKNIEFFNKTGLYLYFIPSEGSNEIGTIGFVNAAFELKEQIENRQLPEPDFIYVALGSGTTTAGLMLGIKAAGLKSVVVPICVQPEEYSDQYAQKVATLYKLTSIFLHLRDVSFPLVTIDSSDVAINHKFAEAGYAHVNKQIYDTIRQLQTLEKITLDGTYTGKAFAAMLDDVQTKKLHDKTILFWNSFCSGHFNDIIGSIDYKELPHGYHYLFESPLQAFDAGV